MVRADRLLALRGVDRGGLGIERPLVHHDHVDPTRNRLEHPCSRWSAASKPSVSPGCVMTLQM